MNQMHGRLSGQRPEITKLDARIAKEGGISSTIDLLPCSLQKAKTEEKRSTGELILENNYLRQEIVYYKQSREAMMAFHTQTLKSFNLLQTALQGLSNKVASAEELMLRYWGIDINNVEDDDVIVF